MRAFALWQALVHSTPDHPPWGLYYTYFGLVSTGVGSAIYQIACPSVIKLFATASEYTATASQISSEEITRVKQELKNGDPQSVTLLNDIDAGYDSRRKFIYKFPSTRESFQDLAQIDLEQARSMLLAHYDYCNRSRAVVRRIVALLYLIGLGLLSYQSIVIFFRVVVAAWTHATISYAPP